MDPYLNSYAFRVLAQADEEASQDQQHQPAWDKQVRQQIGGLLVTLGQRIQPGELTLPMCFEDEMHPSR